LDARLATKSKEVKAGCNLTKSSKEGDGSKRAVLPMMMMINSDQMEQTMNFTFMSKEEVSSVQIRKILTLQ
jgi:hypothetical protein